MKVCSHCYETKKPSEYYKRPNGSLYHICKLCKNEENRKWHAKVAKCVVWRAKKSEKAKAYYHEKVKNKTT